MGSRTEAIEPLSLETMSVCTGRSYDEHHNGKHFHANRLHAARQERNGRVLGLDALHYSNYKRASCDAEFGTNRKSDRCVACNEISFKPTFRKYNSVVGLKFMPVLVEDRQPHERWLWHGMRGLVRQRGLCTLCRVFEDRKVVCRQLHGWPGLNKLCFGNLERPGSIIDRILDYTSGSQSKRAGQQMLKRRNLHETLSHPGMIQETTKYWDRTCKVGEVWTRPDLLDKIISFLMDGYSEKWEGYKHMFEGPQRHQYTAHVFAMLWYLNGQPINMNYIKAIRGHYEHALPPIPDIGREIMLDYPRPQVPMARPTDRYLAEDDKFDRGARKIAAFFDSEYKPTGLHLKPTQFDMSIGEVAIYHGGPTTRGARSHSSISLDWPFRQAFGKLTVTRESLIALTMGRKLLYQCELAQTPADNKIWGCGDSNFWHKCKPRGSRLAFRTRQCMETAVDYHEVIMFEHWVEEAGESAAREYLQLAPHRSWSNAIDMTGLDQTYESSEEEEEQRHSSSDEEEESGEDNAAEWQSVHDAVNNMSREHNMLDVP